MTIPLRAQDWPPFLRELKRLDYKPIPISDELPPGLYRYRVDFSDWRLRFQDDAPLFYVRAIETNLDDGAINEVINDWRRRQTTAHDIFVAIDRPAPELKKEATRNSLNKVIVLDSQDLDEVTSSAAFTHALLRKVTSSYDILDLLPYHIGGHPKRIFDRRAEMSRILRHEDADFAVTGIRRVGKTTLLAEARRRMMAADRDAPPPLFFDCTTFNEPQDFFRALVRELDIRQYTRKQATAWVGFDAVKFLLNASKGRPRPITLFLDEADKLLDLAKRFPDLLNVIRASINNGSCRYIIAGFQSLMVETSNINSPLYLGLELIRVQPFEYEDTKEMLETPFASVGVRFEDLDRTAALLYDETGGLPPLVQFYCAELSRIVQRRGNRVIQVGDVGRIHAAPVLKTLVIDTFRDSVSKPDQLLTYVLLERYGTNKYAYTQQEMYEAMAARHCAIDFNDLDRACDRLELAGVFTRDAQLFRLRLPVFAKLMVRDYKVDFLVNTLQRELVR